MPACPLPLERCRDACHLSKNIFSVLHVSAAVAQAVQPRRMPLPGLPPRRCEVLNYSNATGDATSALLPPGACLLSGGEATDQLSTSSMFGDSLMWSSGYYDPSLAAGTAQGASQTPPSAASTHDSAVSSSSR